MEADVGKYLYDVRQIAREAGAIIQRYYRTQSAAVRIKSDRSPVTDADVAASRFICQALRDMTPWPIVCEEVLEGQTLIKQNLYWLVDPLDGTKEFINRTDEFTVNIALIHQHRPILGVIYAPVFDTLYSAVQNGGAFKQANASALLPLSTRGFNEGEFLYVVSRRHSSQDLEAFRAHWPGCRVELLGSSLKFCWIAEGRADLYIRRGPTCEWDTAAAQCILEEAGGKLVSLQGTPLRYNKGDFNNPEFVACGDRHCKIDMF